LDYKVALTKNFLREFKKLPRDVRNRILRTIDEIVAAPFLGVKLRGELECRWKTDPSIVGESARSRDKI
jgi:mRNA-degrading endonuclease RelE of RelBE toxin-antitoxin system